MIPKGLLLSAVVNPSGSWRTTASTPSDPATDGARVTSVAAGAYAVARVKDGQRCWQHSYLLAARVSGGRRGLVVSGAG